MNIWLLTDPEHTGYDTYDSAVVYANTIEGALKLGEPMCLQTAMQIGTALGLPETGVVCSSYNTR